MPKEIRIVVPDPVWERIQRICRRYLISEQDLILRTLVKVLEEFEK